MWKFIGSLQQKLIWTIPAAMLAGLAAGYAFDMRFIKVTVMPLTFLMVYPMMINLDIAKLFSLQDMKPQLAAQVINFGIIPFVALGLGKFFFPDQPMVVLGLLFAALLPTSGMTISWTGFAKGNMNVAIQMTIVGLITGSVATPLYAKWLMGETIDIPMKEIFISILVVVFLPMVLGVLTRKGLVRLLGEARYQRGLRMKLPSLATLGVLGIVFVAMCLKAKAIVSQPAMLLNYLFPLVILYAINFLISTVAGKLFFNRGDAIALVYGTVMRNLSIALAIAMTVFAERGAEIAIILAFAYIVQVQSAAWYVRFTDRLFGQPDLQPGTLKS